MASTFVDSGTMPGAIAHEMSNLLACLSWAVESAWIRLEPGHPARGEIGRVREVADRASALSRRWLDLCCRPSPALERVAVDRIVEAARILLESVLGDGVVLDLDLAPDLPPVLADGGAFEQVVLELVLNARAAIGADGGAVSIRTSLEAGEDRRPRIEIAVADTGCGMDEATRRRAVEPFFTTRRGRGTGLGLSIVDQIVRAGDGRMEIDSAPGRGTVVRLSFPAAP